LARRGIYLECAGGPLFYGELRRFLPVLVANLKAIGQKESCIFVRIRPQLSSNEEHKRIFRENGFLNSPMHLYAETTWQLNVEKSEEQLLKEMRKTTRYLIKKAIKDGVTIETSLAPEDIDILYKLQLETAKRHRFVPFSKNYFLEELKVFAPENKIKIFKAIYGGEVLAIALILAYGDQAVYHYSGSSLGANKVPASYLLQWEAIKWIKQKGGKIYNFWGIAPTDDSHHRFAGVTLFKKGFGGYRVDYLHAQDLPLNLKYWLIYLFESLRKISRRL
jgi:lipid II:glycine glycyltransferase (peptidoglycan interpeptide bridge formation enzyme)